MNNSENNLNNIEDTENSEKTSEEQTLNEYRKSVLEGKGSSVKSAENLANRQRQDRHTGRGLGDEAYTEPRKVSKQILEEKDDGGKSEIEQGIRDYKVDDKDLSVEEGLNNEYGDQKNESEENWRHYLVKDQKEALEGSIYNRDKDDKQDFDTRTKEEKKQDKKVVKDEKKVKYFGRNR